MLDLTGDEASILFPKEEVSSGHASFSPVILDRPAEQKGVTEQGEIKTAIKNHLTGDETPIISEEKVSSGHTAVKIDNPVVKPKEGTENKVVVSQGEGSDLVIKNHLTGDETPILLPEDDSVPESEPKPKGMKFKFPWSGKPLSKKAKTAIGISAVATIFGVTYLTVAGVKKENNEKVNWNWPEDVAKAAKANKSKAKAYVSQ